MLFSIFVFVLGFIAGGVSAWVVLKREEAASTISSIPTPWPAKSSFDEVYRWHQNTKTTLKRLQDKISKQETQLQQLTLSNNELSERMANLQAAFAAPPPSYHQPRLVPLSDVRTDQSLLSMDQSPDLSSFDGADEQLLRPAKVATPGAARRRSASTGPEAPLQHASTFMPSHIRSPSDPTDPLIIVSDDDPAKVLADSSARPPTIKGWLQIKRVKLWHNYFFALRDSWLSCYRNENMEECLGHINVRGCCIRPRIEKTEFEVYHPKKQPIFKQTPNTWSIGPFGYGMQLMSEGSYTGKLRAPNLDMTRQWMTAISHACQMLEVATAPRDIASTARKQPSEGAERVRFESFSDMPDATPTPSLSSSQGPTSNSIMSQSTPALLGYTATSSSSAAAGGATPAPSTSAAAAASSSTPPSPTTSSEGSLVEVEPAYQWQRTQEEKEALENIIYELQETDEYDSEVLDECTLLRFLRARNMDIERAALMLRDFLKWRNTFKPHLIVMDDVKDAVLTHMVHLHGFDKKGHPAIIIHAQRHDAVNRDVDVMVRFIVFIAQTAVQVMRPPIEKFAIIFDYTGFSSKKNGDWPVSKEAIHILQNYFPERLGYVFLVNYPMMLSALWRMIKPLLDPKTAAKIQFVDLPVLKEYFDEANLLPQHGGTSTYQPSGLSIGLETCTRR